MDLIKIDELKQEFKLEGIEITNNDELNNTCELLKKVKGKINQIQSLFEESKNEAHKKHKEIINLEKLYLEHLTQFEELAKTSVGNYLLQLENNNSALNPITSPTIKGISNSNKYIWKVTNFDKIPIKYLKTVVNNELIDNLIKMTNGTIKIDGIEITKVKIISVKGE